MDRCSNWMTFKAGCCGPGLLPMPRRIVLFRIDDGKAGRELIRRMCPLVASAAHPESPAGDTWVSVALSFQGLKALGVPQASLDSFSPEFQQGMAARAEVLGDTGESSPEHWEKPLGSADVHVVLTALAPDSERLEAALARARQEYQKISGITAIWSQNCHALPNEREAFGFKDGISHPAIEGSGIPGTNPHEPPLKPGEFVLGYPDEFGRWAGDTEAGRFGAQRKLRGLSQIAPTGRRVPPISEGELLRPRRRRTPGREDDGTLA